MHIDKNFASHDECQCLCRAFSENNFAEIDYDFFSGRVLYANDIADQSILKCMHDVSQRALDTVQNYHGPTLYLEALSLVSWPEGKGMNLHYDNAVGYGHDDSATPWRDYSAIVYLNESFDGGEIYFVRDENTQEIKPETGMLVSFDSGPSNWHGVRPPQMAYDIPWDYGSQSSRGEHIR